MLLSGGVDSTVCTALLNKALNQDQVIAVHIDNGFMRKRESQSVEEALTKLGIKLKGGCGLTDGICLLFRLVCQILCGLCIMESYFGGFPPFTPPKCSVVNASHTFYNGTTTLPISEEDRTPRKRISKTLNMTTNPEEKRKIIGDTFVKVGSPHQV